MDELIIGQPGCTFEDLYSIINKSEDINELGKPTTIECLLRKFELINKDTSEHKIKTMVKLARTKDVCNTLQQLVKKWTEKKKQSATIYALICIFNELGLVEISNKLEQHYKNYAVLVKQGKVTVNYRASVLNHSISETSAMLSPSASINDEGELELRCRNLIGHRRCRTESEVSGYASDDTILRDDEAQSSKPLVTPNGISGNFIYRAKTILARHACVSSVATIMAISFVSLIFGPLYYNLELQLRELPIQLKALLSKTNSSKPVAWSSCHPLSPPASYKYFKNATAEVYIYGFDEIEWPMNPPVNNVDGVVSVTWKGKFNLTKLFTMLHDTKSIETLQLINWPNDNYKPKSVISQRAAMQEFRKLKPISLPSLSELKLNGFTFHKIILKALAEKVVTETLRLLEIENTDTINEDILYIEEICKRNKKTLRKISFINSRNSSLLLVRNLPVFQNVEEIVTDFSKHNELIFNVRPDFSQTFPNLRILKSEHGYVSLSSLHKILKCKQLCTLIVGLVVPAELNAVNLNILQNAPQSLKTVHIRFWFLNKLHNDSCSIEGMKEAQKRFTIHVELNC